MRADRLVATLLLMQTRGRVTAAELAEELETSVATARRDLEALSAAGIPVYPQAGRGGGWQLVGGARTDLSGLTSSEARALFLLVGPAAAVAPEAKSALRKLVQALPATFRAEAEAAADAVVLDPSAWGRRPREQSPVVGQLQDAVTQRRQVRITYRGWDRDPEELTVDPWGLVDKSGTWYLLAGVGGVERTFRVQRIADVVVTDEPADRPDDFDVAEAWERAVRQIDAVRHRASAVVIVDTSIVPYLRSQLGEQAVEAERVDDQRTRLRLSAQTESIIARHLAGWGDEVEVVAPSSLRAELARIGRELVDRHATP